MRMIVILIESDASGLTLKLRPNRLRRRLSDRPGQARSRPATSVRVNDLGALGAPDLSC